MEALGYHTIFGDEGEHRTPYMTRIWCGRLRLHIFHRGDADPDCHDHPWDFWTFPLTSYVEEVVYLAGYDWKGNRAPIYQRARHVVRAFRLHYRPANHTHRVIGRWNGNRYVPMVDVDDTKPGKIVTIVWTGYERRKWGFLRNRDGKWCWTPWKEYLLGTGKHAPCEPAGRDALKAEDGR